MADEDLYKVLDAEAASVAASLASTLARFTLETQLQIRRMPGSTASVAGELVSFSSAMNRVAASPASELERLTASAAGSMASTLASFAESLGRVR